MALKGMARFYRSILPTGSYDRLEDRALQKWRNHRFTHIVSLLPAQELHKKTSTSPAAYWSEVQDAVPRASLLAFPLEKAVLLRRGWFHDLSKTLDKLVQSLNKRPRNRVVVHCSAGIGRTGFFYGALLVHLGYSLEDSIACVERNTGKPMTPVKLKALTRYSRWRRN